MQNLYEAQWDQLRDQLTEQCKVLPRAYKEIQDLEDKMGTTIRCIERGFSKDQGAEESDAMRSFIRNNLASEHLKAYPNEAIRQAMNDTLNILSRKGEEQPEELTCTMTFTAMKTTWRRITITTGPATPGVTLSQAASQPSAETEAARTERVMVAYAAQIVAENQAKQAGRAHEPRTKAGDDPEKAQLRKELADMKNQLNQQKKRNDDLRKNKASGPEGYQRYPARGYAQGYGGGGYARDPPRGNYRGGRGQGPGYNQAPRRERSPEPVERSTGFMLRAVGSDGNYDAREAWDEDQIEPLQY